MLLQKCKIRDKIFVKSVTLFTRSAYRRRHSEIVRFSVNHREVIEVQLLFTTLGQVSTFVVQLSPTISDVFLGVLVGSWWSVGVVCFHFKSVLEKISRMATDRQQNTRTRGCTFCGKCVWYQNSWAWYVMNSFFQLLCLEYLGKSTLELSRVTYTWFTSPTRQKLASSAQFVKFKARPINWVWRSMWGKGE